jgi:hypothetical protein
MSVSSVSPSPSVPPVDTSATAPKPAQAATDSSNSDAYQPPVKPPLPPGQGTRVDQLA